MHKTDQKTPADFQAPTAPQPNDGQITPGCGESHGLIWEGKPDRETGNINQETIKSRHNEAYVSQYRDDKTWIAGVSVISNVRARVSEIFKTKEEAKAFVLDWINKPEIELINGAAADLLQDLKDIGYKPQTSIDYATGYDDGYSAALAKMAEFLNIEQKGE